MGLVAIAIASPFLMTKAKDDCENINHIGVYTMLKSIDFYRNISTPNTFMHILLIVFLFSAACNSSTQGPTYIESFTQNLKSSKYTAKFKTQMPSRVFSASQDMPDGFRDTIATVMANLTPDSLLKTEEYILNISKPTGHQLDIKYEDMLLYFEFKWSFINKQTGENAFSKKLYLVIINNTPLRQLLVDCDCNFFADKYRISRNTLLLDCLTERLNDDSIVKSSFIEIDVQNRKIVSIPFRYFVVFKPYFKVSGGSNGIDAVTKKYEISIGNYFFEHSPIMPESKIETQVFNGGEWSGIGVPKSMLKILNEYDIDYSRHYYAIE